MTRYDQQSNDQGSERKYAEKMESLTENMDDTTLPPIPKSRTNTNSPKKSKSPSRPDSLVLLKQPAYYTGPGQQSKGLNLLQPKQKVSFLPAIDEDKCLRLTQARRSVVMHKRLKRRRSILSQMTINPEPECKAQVVLDDERKLLLRRKLRGICRVLIIFLHIWRYHMGKVNEILKTVKGLDALVSAPIEECELMFNLAHFKAARKPLVSNEVRRVLHKRPELRTEEDVHYVMVMMANYDTLVEYPLRMQRLIAQKAWYESYDPKRVLSREGHNPTCFFFVLSGSAVMTTFDTTIEHSKTVRFLQRGHSFGEDVLMSQNVRQETTITKEFIELLVLRDEDFTEIFMSGGLQHAVETFLCNLDYMNGWPFAILEPHPHKAMFTYYKRGTVLMNDTSHSEWIYIVKSGQCSVLKKLHKSQQKLQASSATRNGKMSVTASSLEQIEAKLSTLLDKHAGNPETVQHLTYYNPDVKVPINGIMDEIIEKSSRNAVASSETRNTANSVDYEEIKVQSSVPSALHHRLRYSNSDFNTPSSNNSNIKDLPDVFVMVQLLQPGSCFGLVQAVAESANHPSLSLVSHGAECIVIQKKFFVENAPPALLERLRDQVFPYPTDEAFQTNLDVALHWKHHKHSVINQVLHNVPSYKGKKA